MEIGSLAEMIGAVAAAFGAALSVFALWYARQANHLARQTAEKEDKREEVRRLSHAASNLQAWWVMQEGADASSHWGVVICNNSVGSVFTDVSVLAEFDSNGFLAGESRSDDGAGIKIKYLPPGSYVVWSTPAQGARRDRGRQPYGWDLPVFMADTAGLVPITSSKKHRISKIQFSDELGNRWQLVPGQSPAKITELTS